MPLIKCPKCNTKSRVEAAEADVLFRCPECGQKVRLPASTVKTVDPDEEEAPVARLKTAKPRPADDRERPRRPAEPDGDEPDERPRRKAKGKKTADKTAEKSAFDKFIENTPLLICLVLVSVGLVGTGIFFLVRNRLAHSTPAALGEEEAMEALKAVGGAFELDMNDPKQPVIGASFAGVSLTGKDVQRLRAFTKLQKLNLGHTGVSNIDLDHIEGLTQLRELSLSFTKVSDGGMPSLKKLTNLETLDLSQTIVTDLGLENLKGLKKLKRLNLVDTPLARGRELQAAIPGLEVIK